MKFINNIVCHINSLKIKYNLIFLCRLYVFKGKPRIILPNLIKKWNVTHLSYEHDIQPNWKKTESFLKEICKENDVEVIDCVSHTLWKTEDILKANGGIPPVTYEVFCHVSY